MACEKYTSCDYCFKKSDCPFDFMGDGSPFCCEFQCTVEGCKRFECISFEEIFEEFM